MSDECTCSDCVRRSVNLNETLKDFEQRLEQLSSDYYNIDRNYSSRLLNMEERILGVEKLLQQVGAVLVQIQTQLNERK